MKECSRCHLELSADHYYPSNKWTCIGCVKARANLRYKADPEKHNAYAKQYALEHPEQVASAKQKWRDANRDTVIAYARFRREFFPEAITEANRKYRDANKEVYATATAKRRATLLNAFAGWADAEVINLFYEFALLLSEAAGEPYEVDHIVPLQGELVSGLHVETNLRVVPQRVNRQKSNKHGEEHV